MIALSPTSAAEPAHSAPLVAGRRVLRAEADALIDLAAALDERFERSVEMIAAVSGRVVVTGMGKSGIICRKIAATFSSTGTPAFFMHPAEAIHGDLGMIVEGDTVLAISNSGETQELVRLSEYIKRLGAFLIAITANGTSTLAGHADIHFAFRIKAEGCPIGLAPMASTTTTLAIGDALAAALMARRGFTPQDFARFHPGGKLGRHLLTVQDVMHAGDAKPIVKADTTLARALVVMSEKRLGMTAVDLGDDQVGMISDGDIRRALQAHGSQALETAVADLCTRRPKSIGPDRLAAEALHVMERMHITSLLVLNDAGNYVGVVHLHDLWKTQLV